MLEKTNAGSSLSTPIVQPLTKVKIPPTETYDKDNTSMSLAEIEVICMSVPSRQVRVGCEVPPPRYTKFTFDVTGGNWSHMVAIDGFDCWDSEIVSYNDMKSHMCDPTGSKFTNIYKVGLNFIA
jgi:hypothetical protein